MKAVVFGNGYWSLILQKYIKEKFEIIDVIDVDTPDEQIDEAISKADVAFVCTPVSTHYAIVKRLLNKKISVFCEKVLTKNQAETEELYLLAKKNNAILLVDYTYIYSESISYIKRNIEQIGKIKKINASITQFGKIYQDVNGLETIGVHILAAIHYILNDYSCVEKVTFYDKEDLYDNTVKFHISSCSVYLRCSLKSNVKSRVIEFVGENGVFTYDMLGENTVIFKSFTNVHNYIEKTYNEHDNLRFIVNEFEKIIKDKKDNSKNEKIAQCIASDLEVLNQGEKGE